MFLLILAVAITNLALGYALAVYLGWAKAPEFGKPAVPAEQTAALHDQGQ